MANEQIKKMAKNILDIILEMKKLRHITDAELEKELRIKPKTIATWKMGTSKSFMDILPDIAKCLSVDVDFILQGSLLDKNVKKENEAIKKLMDDSNYLYSIGNEFYQGFMDNSSRNELEDIGLNIMDLSRSIEDNVKLLKRENTADIEPIVSQWSQLSKIQQGKVLAYIDGLTADNDKKIISDTRQLVKEVFEEGENIGRENANQELKKQGVNNDKIFINSKK